MIPRLARREHRQKHGFPRIGITRYLDAFEAVWDLVHTHMISQAGEWYILLDRQGNVIDSHTGNPWKVAYHTGRAMIECLERIDRLVGEY